MPFEIPESWVWTTINDIAFVTKLAGFEYTKYIADNISKNDGIPLFKGKNVLNGEVVYEFESYIPRHISDELFRSQISKKCLLTPYVGTIGNIGIHNKEGIYHLGSNVGKIELFNGLCVNVYEEYVKFYLLSSYGYKELTKHKKATAQESISIEAIREVLIPLPPVAEQLRIVNEIDDKLSYIKEINKDSGKIGKLIGIAKSKILDLALSGKLVPQDPNDEPAIELLKRVNPNFQPCDNSHYENLPFEVPNNWCWATINGVTEFIKNGAQIKQFKGASGIPITRIETISNSEMDLSRMGYADITDGDDFKDHYIKNGDILMSHINSRIHIGKCALCNVGVNKIIHGMNLLRIRCRNQIMPEYMVLYFRSTTFYNLIEPYIKNAVNQASINITNLQNILVPVPPYREQRKITLMVNKLFSTIDAITAEL